jgi:hypothetical protein
MQPLFEPHAVLLELTRKVIHHELVRITYDLIRGQPQHHHTILSPETPASIRDRSPSHLRQHLSTHESNCFRFTGTSAQLIIYATYFQPVPPTHPDVLGRTPLPTAAMPAEDSVSSEFSLTVPLSFPLEEEVKAPDSRLIHDRHLTQTID